MTSKVILEYKKCEKQLIENGIIMGKTSNNSQKSNQRYIGKELFLSKKIRKGNQNMQDELRKEVIDYLEEYGLRKSALSSYLKISPQYLSDWLHKRCDFDVWKLSETKKFLSRRWYYQVQ